MRKTMIAIATAAAIPALATGAFAEGAPASPVGDAPGVTTAPASALLQADDVIGRTVVGGNDERLGEVADVLADDTGNARVLVIDLADSFDPDKEIGVDIEQGRVALHDDWVAVQGLTRADIAALPDIRDDQAVATFGSVAGGKDRWPAGLAPLPGWFAEPMPDYQ